jgi:O-antigen/teichoic acid export membrane protein
MKLFNKLQISSNRKILLKNVSWSLIGRIVQIANALIIGVIIARYLKPDQYGILNYAAGYVAMFPLITEFGLTGILTRELAKKSTDRDSLIGSAIFLRFALSLLTIILIFISLTLFKEDGMMRNYILINAINFIFLSVSMTINNYFNSQLQNDQNVKAEIFRVGVLAVIKIMCVLLKAPLFVFIILTAVDSAVLLVYSLPLFVKFYGNLSKLKVNKTYIKILLYGSFPLLLEGVTGVFYQKLDVVMTGKLLDAEAVAYYVVALKFVDFAIFIPLVLIQTMTPMLVRKFEECNYDRENSEYIRFKNKVGDIITYSGLFVTLCLIISAYPVITILYGADYHLSIPLLQILAIKGLFCGLAYPVSAIIVSEGRQKLVFLTNVIGAAVYIVLSFILIPKLGLTGVALSTLISFIVGAYFANFLIPRYRKDFYSQTGFLFKGPKRIIGYLKNK